MKLFFIGLALLATVYGEYSSEYQVPQDSLSVLEEIETLNPSSSQLVDDGYRYKTVRRFRARHRRDVSELVNPEYLPPVDEYSYQAPAAEYLAPIAPIAPVAEIPSGVLADDGYRYKTVRKLRLRHRRDVNELVNSEYLPPVDEYSYQAPASEYLAPIAPVAPVAEIPSGILADDGYRYKTVRKLRHRHRRDVSELTQYLPPAQEEVSYEVPSNEYLAPIAPGQQFASGILADDGYRYKTIRRLRHRQRRDVNELTQYLPPAAEEISYDIPSNEYLAPIDSGVLADDGYRYKTVRRLRHRQRRDVSELASAQYLPPVQENIPQAPVVSISPVADIPIINNEYLAPLQQIDTVLADDGYRYKTVKRFKIRRH